MDGNFEDVLVVHGIANLLISPSITPLREPTSDRSHGFHIHEHGNCRIETHRPSCSGGINPQINPWKSCRGFPCDILKRNGEGFFTDKFSHQVVGKSIVIHQNPDDYRSQPAGNAGKRLACGVIEAIL